MAGSEDLDVLAKLVDWLSAGEEVALATVLESWGSSPRPAGSHMAVRVDGLFWGSVSGGCVENAVVVAAQQTLDTGQPKTLMFGIDNDQAWRNGLSCGGRIAVLVQPVSDPAPFSAVLSALAEGRSSALLFKDGGITQLDDIRAAADGEFIRVYPPLPRLIVVGAVHIAEYLAPMAEMAGFQVEVIDPRRSFGRRQSFTVPPTIALPELYFQENPPDCRTALVSLVHAPATDDPALLAGLRSPAFYIGALGSRKTHSQRISRLMPFGLEVERIHAPIGLDIGARGPAEIAVAILAEVITAWRQSGR